ncbi:hypothetical protein NL317_31455, partial [Klebsiella pneumoniae]|nr:hypothetical protein [Klebsiella pneumoniae]
FSTATAVLTVTNAAPTAVIGNTGPVAEGRPVSISLTGATDPSPADAATLRFSFARTAGELTGYAGAQTGGSASFTFTDNG